MCGRCSNKREGFDLDMEEVFAIHYQESESQYVSDVFAFDPRDGTLVESILGMSYQRVPFEDIHKVLARAVLSDSELTTTAMTPASTPDRGMPSVPTSFTSTSALLFEFQDKKAVMPAVMKTIKKVLKKPGSDVSANTREIVCNLSGLEPEEIKDDSDLIELGIDSLMAMELVREVYASFKCTLQNEQLMDLTDFHSLVKCIQSTLGFDDDDDDLVTDNEFQDGAAAEKAVAPNVITSHVKDVNTLSASNDHSLFSTSTILDIFYKIKWKTDDAINEGELGGFFNNVMPRSTELCLAYVVEAFEQLGCSIRSSAPGEQLRHVEYLPKHEKYMKLIYGLLESDARLIDINGTTIVRTAVAPPAKSAEALLKKLLHDEPIHAAEYKLTALIGAKFANLITGKEDGLQLIFGAPDSRELAVAWYANSPVNTVWIKQLAQFLERLLGTLPKNGQPVNILEVGAGTGGTASKILPVLAQLGVPVKNTMTDISGSLIAAARKRFKHYLFIEFKVHNMESDPDPKLLQSQHIVLATNCVHATLDLSISLRNLHRFLRPDVFLIVLEMTEQVPWVDFIFCLMEGWWLFDDGRDYVLQPPAHWEKILRSEGYGHVD
jgi:acyl carrier protein/SAM-dependent methyltransferase